MKNIFTYLLITLTISLIYAEETVNENLVGNGEFNTSSGWKLVDARYQPAVNNSEANRYLQLKYGRWRNGNKARRSKASRASQRIHLKKNSKYRISLKVKGNPGASKAYFARSSGKLSGHGWNLSGLLKKAKNVGDGWKQIEIIYNSPKKFIKYEWFTIQGKNPFQIDDISIVKL